MSGFKMLSKKLILPLVPFLIVIMVIIVSFVIILLLMLHSVKTKFIVQDNTNILNRNSVCLPTRMDYPFTSIDGSISSSSKDTNSVIPKPMKIGNTVFGNLTNISKLSLILSTPMKSNSTVSNISENDCVLTYNTEDMGNTALILGKSAQKIQSSDIYEMPKLVDAQICQAIKTYYKISSSDNIILLNETAKKIDWTSIPYAYVSTDIMKNDSVLLKNVRIAYFNNNVDGCIDYICLLPDNSKLNNASQMFFGELEDLKTVVMQSMGE